jgi:hypothetical protein
LAGKCKRLWKQAAGATLAVSGSGVFDQSAPIKANINALRLAVEGLH